MKKLIIIVALALPGLIFAQTEDLDQKLKALDKKLQSQQEELDKKIQELNNKVQPDANVEETVTNPAGASSSSSSSTSVIVNPTVITTSEEIIIEEAPITAHDGTWTAQDEDGLFTATIVNAKLTGLTLTLKFGNVIDFMKDGKVTGSQMMGNRKITATIDMAEDGKVYLTKDKNPKIPMVKKEEGSQGMLYDGTWEKKYPTLGTFTATIENSSVSSLTLTMDGNKVVTLVEKSGIYTATVQENSLVFDLRSENTENVRISETEKVCYGKKVDRNLEMTVVMEGNRVILVDTVQNKRFAMTKKISS